MIEIDDFLEESLWTPELEYALERFSISTYLDWFDDCSDDDPWTSGANFPDMLLYYLQDIVSHPWHKTKYQLQLLILIRENLTFITVIPCII